MKRSTIVYLKAEDISSADCIGFQNLRYHRNIFPYMSVFLSSVYKKILGLYVALGAIGLIV